MAAKRKMSGKDMSLPVGIICGVIASLVVTLIGALAVSYMVIKEMVSMDSIGLGVMCIAALATACGAWIASLLSNKNKLLNCGLTALAYYLMLLSVNAVFFDGIFTGMGITALMILLGAGISLLPGLRKKTGKSKIKIPAYR